MGLDMTGEVSLACCDLGPVIVANFVGDDSCFAKLGVGFGEDEFDLVLADEGPDRELGDCTFANVDLFGESGGVLFCDADAGEKRVDLGFAFANLRFDGVDLSFECLDDSQYTNVAVGELGGGVVRDLLKFNPSGEDSAVVNRGDIEIVEGRKRRLVEIESRDGVDPRSFE